MRDFRIPSRCKGDVQSSGILHGVVLYSLTAISGQPIGPVFKQENGTLRWDPQIVPKRR